MTAPQERPAGRSACGARPAGAPVRTPAVGARSREDLVAELVPLAVTLVGTVRDYGPDAVQGVLNQVPDGRHDALAVVLAAMVDPDRTPSELLGWLDQPAQSQPFTPPRRGPRAVKAFDEIAVERATRGDPVRLRPVERAEAVRRLTAAGRSAAEIAALLGTTKRSVTRHRNDPRRTA